MRVFVVEPPAPVVTWEEADRHLQLDGDVSQQALVEGFIAAATGHIDGPDGWLGRAIGVQTLEARFDLFECGRHAARLPYPPALELVSVQYRGADDVLRDGAVIDFELLGEVLVPAGMSFPWEGGSLRREAVRVRYRAGYETLPSAIRAAILLMVGDLFANRETVVTGSGAGAVSVPMSTTVEALLRPFRVFR